MIRPKPLTLGDKALIDSYLSPLENRASEMTFTNLFIWRNFYRFHFAVIHGLLCIIAMGTGKAKPFCLCPSANMKATIYI